MQANFTKTTLFLWVLLFSLLSNAQEEYTWGNVAIGGGGFVTGIITNPAEQDLIYARTDVGGAYRWDAGNQQWLPLLDRIPEEDRGLYGIESLATDPQAPNRLYLLAGTSYFSNGKSVILKSLDYGATFTEIDITAQFSVHGNGMGRQNGEKLHVDPNNSNILYVGSRNSGLFKSTDAGDTWSHQPGLAVTTTGNENGISFVLLDASSVMAGATQTLYAGISRFGNNFYRSDDAGATWAPVAGAPADLLPQRAKLAGDGNMYITYGDGAGPHAHWSEPEPYLAGAVWKYNTVTGVWTDVSPSNAHPFCGVSIDPSDANRVIVSSTNRWSWQYDIPGGGSAYGDQIFLTTDGGASWTDLVSASGISIDPNGVSWIPGNSIHWAGSIEFDPFNPQKAWVVSGNGIFVNENIAVTPGVWRFEVNGLEETVPQELISIPNGPILSVISDYDGFLHTDVTQYAPIHNPTMGSTTGIAYASLNPDKIVRVGQYMYYSTDRGETWTQTASLEAVSGQVAVSADGTIILHSPQDNSLTYRTDDNGTTWAEVSGLSVTGAKPVADPVNTNNFYAYNPSNGDLLISTDAGATFSVAGNAGSGGGKRMALAPDREGHIWVPLGEGGLARSSNTGTSFTTLGNVTACSAVGFGEKFNETGYPTLFIWGTINGETGIFRSIDEGASWLRINDDAHQYGGPGNGRFIVGDNNVFGRVYMSTVGRGIVYGESDGNVDIIEVTAIDIMPASLMLLEEETAVLTAAVNPGNATIQSVIWTTSDPAVATVDASGAVTGIATGTATITATADDGSGVYAESTVEVQGDSDGDGILDGNDACPDTPSGNTVDVNGCTLFSLPATNFTITNTAETCRDSNNGSITVEARENYTYTAALTGEGISQSLPFTTGTEFNELPAGNYSLCITLAEEAGYEVCYDLIISEPEPLAVFSEVSAKASTVTVSMAGGDYYEITLNDEKFITYNDTVELPLQPGKNTLEVKTGKACQGVYKETLFADHFFHIYPNPVVNNEVYINSGTTEENITVELFSLAGKLLFKTPVQKGNEAARVQLPVLPAGTYVLKISTPSKIITFKILKR